MEILRVRSRFEVVAVSLLVAGVFSIPLLGAAAHNLLLGLALLIGLVILPAASWKEMLNAHLSLKLGLALFIWLGLSSLWSMVDPGEALSYWSKYRELLIVPVFAILMARQGAWRDKVGVALYLGLFLSLVASYLIHFNWVDWTENEHSLKNRIFHGISMSLFAYLTLRVALSDQEFKWRSYRYLAWGVYLTTVYSVFFIENGRTGYVCFFVMSGIALVEKFGFKKALLFGGIATAAFIVAAAGLGAEHIRVLNGHDQTEGASWIMQIQGIDIRIEYWVISFFAYLNQWLMGYGVGSFELAYEMTHSVREAYWGPSGNAHNEILMIAVQSGIVGILLYLGFVFTLTLFRAENNESEVTPVWFKSGTAMASLIFVAGLFNSSIMDHGDGILFASALSLMFAGAKMPAFLFAADAKSPAPEN